MARKRKDVLAKTQGNAPRRRSVKVILGVINDSMSLDHLTTMLADVAQRAELEDISNVETDISQERGYYDDVSVTVYLVGWRDETDEEMALRIQQEQEYATNQAERDRQEFERMKRQYGWG